MTNVTYPPRTDDADRAAGNGLHRASLAFAPELQRFAARRLGDWGYAEDAVQETLIRAWRSADRFDPGRGTLRTWLYAILRNLLIDMARTHARRHASFLTEDVCADGSTDESEALVTSLAVSSALQRLTAEHRQVIEFCYLRSLPHAEVARMLGVPSGTIRSRLFYARDALRQALGDTVAGAHGIVAI